MNQGALSNLSRKTLVWLVGLGMMSVVSFPGGGASAGVGQGQGGSTAGMAASPLATFTVTNLNDSGAGSLRDAIASANAAMGADTINFQADLTGTITLTSGELVITDSVTITGPGAGLLAVSGSNTSTSGIVGQSLTFTGSQRVIVPMAPDSTLNPHMNSARVNLNVSSQELSASAWPVASAKLGCCGWRRSPPAPKPTVFSRRQLLRWI